MDLVGRVLADRFEVERLVGAGGMGAVLRAHDRATGAPVAVKVLHEALVGGRTGERFAREAAVLAELRHPGIVRYVGGGTTPDGRPFLAMEWLEGEDLATRLARQGLPLGETLVLARHVAHALAAAHAAGILHRDVKPSNLFLPGGDVASVKLVDFGVARPVGGWPPVTRTGSLIGTPAYMPPEQARGRSDLDARVDVYALGCVVFECLAGRPAFAGEGLVAVLAKVLLEDPPRLRSLRPDVPPDLDGLVARLLDKDRDARPADGAALVRLLADLAPLGEGALAPVEPHRAPALTRGELRYVSVILARPPGAAGTLADTVAAPLVPDRADEAVRAVVRAHGGRVERLADGSMLVVLSGDEVATDRAARAARCALALRDLLPTTPLALATGRADVALAGAVGEVIDRAGRLLASARAGAILVDVATSGLLESRFVLGAAGAALELEGERDAGAAARTLLGRPTAFVGRARELGVLTATLEECLDESLAQVVLVTAPAGVGKTRLRQEFTRAVVGRGPGIVLWIAAGDPLRAGSPFGLVAPLVRSAAGIRDGEPGAARRLRDHVARRFSGEDLDRIAAFLGELAGVEPELPSPPLLALARQDAAALGDRMRDAWEEWLQAEVADHPLVIVLEDLHWGDLPSVRLLDTALRRLERRRLFVLALARPEVHATFPGLWEGRRLQELRLPELTRRAAERLVRDALGAASDEVVERIVARGAGNAFFLEELVRAAAAGRDEEPETVLAMVQARLEGLDPDHRRLLRAASVYGEVFWGGAVGALLGEVGSAASLDEGLEELARREVVTPRREARFPGETEHAFRHALVRDAAYAMLTEADRALGHRLAGEWLEREGEGDALTLAEHFERGGALGKAVHWLRCAAEQALEGGDLAAAIRHAERGVACGARGDDLGALRRVQAEAHQWRGESEEAVRCGLEALAALRAGSPAWWRAAGDTVMGGVRHGHLDVDAIVAEMVARGAGPEASDERLVGSLTAAMALTLGGRPGGDALLAQVDATPGLLDRSALVVGWVHRVRAMRAVVAGDLGGHAAELQASLGAFQRLGSARDLVDTHANLGFGLMELGALVEAEAHLRWALAMAERAGLGASRAMTWANLGLLLVRRDALAEAGEALREGERLNHDHPRAACALATYAAMRDLAAGDLAAAVADTERAEGHARGYPLARGFLLAVRARALRLSGRLDEARVAAEAAQASLDAHGVDEGEAFVRMEVVEARLAAGDVAGARAALAVAKERLLDAAARIRDERLRAAFLRDLPENARTLSLVL